VAENTPQYVVRIECETPRGPSTGSGFLVNDGGLVATCLHVVEGATGPISVILPYTKPWKYEVLHGSEDDDLALLGLVGGLGPNVPTPHAVLYSGPLGPFFREDAKVLAYGHSGRDHLDAPQALACTISAAVEADGRVGLVGSIHPGDSGGPIVGEDRRVIGVVQVRDPNRAGRAMAIPVSLLLKMLRRWHVEHDEAGPGAGGGRSKPISMDAIPRPPEPYIAHPYTLLDVDSLIGRADELDMLDGWFGGTDPELSGVRLMILHALGGAGKSALTWDWFNRRAVGAAGKLWWSFYAAGSSFAAFVVQALRYITRKTRKQIARLDVDERIDLLVRTLDEERFLLVLDGFERVLIQYAVPDVIYADDLTIDGVARPTPPSSRPGVVGGSDRSSQSSVRRRTTDPWAGEFLRRALSLRASRILMTTRLVPSDVERKTGDLRPGCRAVDLGEMRDEDALALWRRYGVSGTDAELLPFFRTFENHPLLIKTLAGEVAHFREAPGDFARWKGLHPGFDPFSLPLEQVRTHILQFALDGLDDPAKTLLQNIAAFRMPVPYVTLRTLLVGPDRLFEREADLGKKLDELEDRGLVGWDPAARRHDLHPVVRGVAWNAVDPSRRGPICDQLYTFFERDEALRGAVERVSSLDDLAVPIEMMNLLLRQGKYDEAATLYQERILGHRLRGEVTAHRFFADLLLQFFPDGTDKPSPAPGKWGASLVGMDLAEALTELGRPGEALPLYEERAKVCSCDACQTSLSGPLLALGRLYDAELIERHVLARPLSFNKDQPLELRCTLILAILSKWRIRDVNRKTIPHHLSRINGLIDIPESLGEPLMLNAWTCFWLYHVRRYMVSLDQGDGPEAARRADLLWAAARVQGDETRIGRAAAIQGEVALKAGDHDRAEERLLFAQAEARRSGRLDDEMWNLEALARLRVATGDLDAARGHLDEVWPYALQGPLPLLHARALNILAGIEEQEGRRDEAVAAAREAYRLSWCDGPPFAAAGSLENARRRLATLGAEPPAMPPFDPSGREPMPNIRYPHVSKERRKGGG
jgi:hypothetical protein